MGVTRSDDLGARGALGARALTISGFLLLVGFVANGIQRSLLHPSGAEDDHESIFTEYTQSDVWVATHLAEFVLVLVTLAGLLVLCHAVRQEAPYLALGAAGALVTAAATWTALQAVDGVTLKEAVDAWAGASGDEKAARYSDAETVRWIEWGLQAYFRVLLGIAFVLLGAALAASRLVATWLATVLGLAGTVSLALGISVAYAGLESGLQDALALIFQLVVLVFVAGLLIAGRQARQPRAGRQTPKH